MRLRCVLLQAALLNGVLALTSSNWIYFGLGSSVLQAFANSMTLWHFWQLFYVDSSQGLGVWI
jgi:hypothetical protein